MWMRVILIAVCGVGAAVVVGGAGASSSVMSSSDDVERGGVESGGVVAIDRFEVMEASPQSEGDVEAGREFLLYGDYIGAGFPYDFFVTMVQGGGGDGGGDGGGATSLIERRGKAAGIPHDFNHFVASDGTELVGGMTCLGCHSSMFEGALVIGLGNSFSDWTGGEGPPVKQLQFLLASRYGVESEAYKSGARLIRGMSVLFPDINTPFRGVNPAFKLEEIAAAHRNPADLTWTESPRYRWRPEVVASDVPPWWHVKKKHGLYYTGMGRGDFAKLIQQITVVGIEDDAAADRIYEGMKDLLAFVRSIEPPPYPKSIDRDLAADGRVVFEQNCSKCHGTYGEAWTYPNRRVSVEVVGTDPLYAEHVSLGGLPRWVNESWFARTAPRAWVEPALAYVAPPLDGVWITAPYLHNGSVPTLASLLDSSKRPTYWRRSFRSDDFDYERVGWNYDEPPGPVDVRTYDTTRPGYGNGGHTFGDDLTESERRALLEYLKTL